MNWKDIITLVLVVIFIGYVLSYVFGIDPFCRHVAYTRGGRICLDTAKYRQFALYEPNGLSFNGSTQGSDSCNLGSIPSNPNSLDSSGVERRTVARVC